MSIVAILIAGSNLYWINFAMLDIAYFKYELEQKNIDPSLRCFI